MVLWNSSQVRVLVVLYPGDRTALIQPQRVSAMQFMTVIVHVYRKDGSSTRCMLKSSNSSESQAG